MLKSNREKKTWVFTTNIYVYNCFFLPGLVPFFRWKLQNLEVGGGTKPSTTDLPVPPLLVAMVEEHAWKGLLQRARWQNFRHPIFNRKYIFIHGCVCLFFQPVLLVFGGVRPPSCPISFAMHPSMAHSPFMTPYLFFNGHSSEDVGIL